MTRDIYRKIIELILKAAELAKSAGINNLLQPGLVKEMIMADILMSDSPNTGRERMVGSFTGLIRSTGQMMVCRRRRDPW